MSPPSRRSAAAATLLAPALAVAGCALGEPDPPPAPVPVTTPGAGETADPAADLIGVPETLVTGLEVPWGVAFLPDGAALVTERDSGRILRVEPGELGDPAPPAVTEVRTVAVDATGDGGLLGIAVSPEYSEDESVYVYYSTVEDNRIGRITVGEDLPEEPTGEPAGEPKPVLTGIPRAEQRNGGRLAFGPDGYLYAGTGDAGDPAAARDLESLAGKILRLLPDGDPAPENPFDSPVWAYGFRDVQGLAWDDAGHLWATELGADTDELNLIEPGGDYGWPDATEPGAAGTDQEEVVDPQVRWPAADAGCAGAAVTGTVLVAACLPGQRLSLLELTGSGSVLGRERAALVEEFGRLRTPVRAPDGSVWVTTSNRDGQLPGDVHPDDDRIIRLSVSGDGGAGRS